MTKQCKSQSKEIAALLQCLYFFCFRNEDIVNTSSVKIISVNLSICFMLLILACSEVDEQVTVNSSASTHKLQLAGTIVVNPFVLKIDTAMIE